MRRGRSFRPPPRGVWFEEAGKGYAQRVFGDAPGMTYRMRKLMSKTNERAGSEEIPTAAIEKTSTRSLRIAMATLLLRKGVPAPEVVAMGEWEDEAMMRTYVEVLATFANERRNYTDDHINGRRRRTFLA